MKNPELTAGIIFLSLILNTPLLFSQQEYQIPVSYEEITAPGFKKAIEKSGSTCIIPLGILEKHGPHLPVGTDLFEVREIALRAAEKNYTVVFPEFYFGQIFEAKHQPGAIAYSPELVWKVLEETCKELSRNGFKKIILVNGHGGNNNLLPYFCQAQLASEKDYVVVYFRPSESEEFTRKLEKLKKTNYDGHAGEEETSMMMVIRPDLVYAENASAQDGTDRKSLEGLEHGYTGIWWYGSYPNHYAGDGSYPETEIGELLINNQVEQLVKLIQYLKTNSTIKTLQDKFYRESNDPLSTSQGM